MLGNSAAEDPTMVEGSAAVVKGPATVEGPRVVDGVGVWVVCTVLDL